MAPKFGTSGLRGLVTDLTPALIADHVRAFAAACPMGAGLYVARDLRPSSPGLARIVLDTARAEGLATVDCGEVPTPALALAAMGAGAAAIMVTGSHIPADRNGLKFYLPDGEIAKSDESAILAHLGRPPAGLPALPTVTDTLAGPAWVARYVSAFGNRALDGLRLGVWMHSGVGCALIADTCRALGAWVTELAPSSTFVPVDTEAVPPEARASLAGWAATHRLDAILSADGDGDRPLLTDATGAVIPGDVLGQITAAALGADVVVTPVSSNTGVEAGNRFSRVIRTRIGSPFVIAGMAAAARTRVVGYEANGGFLLGFVAQGPAGPLSPLATRDSLLPMIAPLSQARAAGGLAALVATQPPRFTAADRLTDIPTDRSSALVQALTADPVQLAALAAALDDQATGRIDLTDGLRLTLASGRILHVRPSGNAPELRLYVEGESPAIASTLLHRGLARLRLMLA